MNENFLLNFVKLAAGTEIPEIFAVWSGVASISCMLGRRVFLDMGAYTVYPNIYTILVASSGRHRKSSSLNLASDLIYELPLPPNIIPQKITPEALLDALKDNQAPTGLIASESSTGFVFASEFATFFNRKSYEQGLGSMLTDFWDCPKTWQYRTKARGVEKLEQPCIGLLGASTVDWLRDAIPSEAVGGGFTSRCVFVYSETPPKPIARTTFDAGKLQVRESLLRSLQKLSTINGSSKLTEEAWVVYEEEYNQFCNTSDMYESKPLSGYASRRNVHWLKLAMIFAAADGQLEIEARHLKGSLKILKNAEVHLKVVMNLLTATEMGANIAFAEEFIKSKKKVERTVVVRYMLNKLSARQLTEVLDTLLASGAVQLVNEGKTAYYIWMEK